MTPALFIDSDHFRRKGSPRSAHYVYASRAYGELLCEEHLLKFARPSMISEAMIKSGFRQSVHNESCINVPIYLRTKVRH